MISQYFWLLLLVLGAVNYRRALRAAPLSATGNPDTEAHRYMQWFAIGATLPWVVMGMGYVCGYTPTVWYYFRPQEGNPFVVAWLVTVFATMIVYSYWVLFADGIEKILGHNLMSVLGRRNMWLQFPGYINFLAVCGPLFLPAWIYFMASMNLAVSR